VHGPLRPERVRSTTAGRWKLGASSERWPRHRSHSLHGGASSLNSRRRRCGENRHGGPIQGARGRRSGDTRRDDVVDEHRSGRCRRDLPERDRRSGSALRRSMAGPPQRSPQGAHHGQPGAVGNGCGEQRRRVDPVAHGPQPRPRNGNQPSRRRRNPPHETIDEGQRRGCHRTVLHRMNQGPSRALVSAAGDHAQPIAHESVRRIAKLARASIAQWRCRRARAREADHRTEATGEL
jgi:hypothetical protein